MRVYEAIAEGLAAEGCNTIFALMGDGNLLLMDALQRAGAVDICAARHEAAAVAMADGFHRATGEVGVVTITRGPALTHSSTSLIGAARNRTPLVVLTAELSAGDRNRLQGLDQRRFVEACECRYAVFSRPENVADELAEAFFLARRDRIPVVLATPMDMLQQSVPGAFSYKASTGFLPVSRADEPADSVIEVLLEMIRTGERPVIVAGRGAIKAGANSEIIALADRIGALVATSLLAKDTFGDYEYNVGVAGGYGTDLANTLLAQADLVIGVGAQVGYHTTDGGRLFANARIVRIDVEPAPREIGIAPGAYICGDARSTLARLNTLLDDRDIRMTGFRTQPTITALEQGRTARHSQRAGDGADPSNLCIELTKVIPENAAVVCGLGHFSAFPAMFLTLPTGADFHCAFDFGPIGQALPLGIGVSMAQRSRPTIVIEGDGGLIMNLQELETAARLKLPLILIVWNDAGFGAEVHKLRKQGLDWRPAQWTSPDFIAIARAVGGDGMVVRHESEIVEAVAAGLEVGGLYVIDAQVSPTTISPYHRRILYPDAHAQ